MRRLRLRITPLAPRLCCSLALGAPWQPKAAAYLPPQDSEVEWFVKQRAPPAFVSTFARYTVPIQKVDTFRYVLMLSVGAAPQPGHHPASLGPSSPPLLVDPIYLSYRYTS